MRLSHAVLGFLLLLPFAACGGNDDDHAAYDTYQACFDDHSVAENLPVQEAIVICCLDHPIAGMGNPVCGSTAADCTTYLGTNLAQSSANSNDVDAACHEYIRQKNM